MKAQGGPARSCCAVCVTCFVVSLRLAWPRLQQEWLCELLHGPWHLQERRLCLRVRYVVSFMRVHRAPCTVHVGTAACAWCGADLASAMMWCCTPPFARPPTHTGWHGPGCDQPDVISGGSSGVFTFDFKDTSDGEKFVLGLTNGDNNCTWCGACKCDVLGGALLCNVLCGFYFLLVCIALHCFAFLFVL